MEGWDARAQSETEDNSERKEQARIGRIVKKGTNENKREYDRGRLLRTEWSANVAHTFL